VIGQQEAVSSEIGGSFWMVENFFVSTFGEQLGDEPRRWWYYAVASSLAASILLPEAARRSGGRNWWAHFAFTRINIERIILPKEIEDLRDVREVSSEPQDPALVDARRCALSRCARSRAMRAAI